MTDLAPDTDTPSPRLQWMFYHDLVVRKADLHCVVGAGSFPWMCSNRAHTRCGFGDTARDAEIDWALRHGVEHWAVQDWNAAMR